MAEHAHEMGYYELTAVCARKIAEMYVSLLVKEDHWSLYEGMSKLPCDIGKEIWLSETKAHTPTNVVRRGPRETEH